MTTPRSGGLWNGAGNTGLTEWRSAETEFLAAIEVASGRRHPLGEAVAAGTAEWSNGVDPTAGGP